MVEDLPEQRLHGWLFHLDQILSPEVWPRQRNREKFARYQVIAEVASNLKKAGYSNEDIREMLAVSGIVKSVAAEIYRSKESLRNSKGFVTYFDVREIVESFSNPEYDFSSLPKIDKPESKNSAILKSRLVSISIALSGGIKTPEILPSKIELFFNTKSGDVT